MARVELTADDGGGRHKTVIGDFPSNSEKEREKLKAVVTGVVKQPPTIGKRIKAFFVVEDGRTIMSYVIVDVIIPAAKDMLADATRELVDRALYGDSRRARESRSGYTAYGRTSRSSSSSRDKPSSRGLDRRSRASHDFTNLVFSTREEATDVFERLANALDDFETVSVADLYDLCDLASEFVDQKWGWENLSTASIRRVRDGFIIDLPTPKWIE